MTDENPTLLFDFESAQQAAEWQSVNDGVMGGRSDGRFQMTSDGRMRFFGDLSLQNNGGFASVRSRPKVMPFKAGDTILMRVRGDGRTYAFNLYVPRRLTAFSYRLEFPTTKDQWIEVELPLEKFVATSFGRVVRNQPLRPAEVDSLGILLGDKKAGPFSLEVDWIKVRSAP